MENIRSLLNVGAIMRTSEFFGIKEVWLVGYTGREMAGVDELNHKLAKSALGAEKNLRIKFFRNSLQLIKHCTKNKYPLIAIEQHPQSIKLPYWQPQPNSVLVFGNETYGVSQEIIAASSQTVEIPRLGTKNSLNVATVAGIIIYYSANHSSTSFKTASTHESGESPS